MGLPSRDALGIVPGGFISWNIYFIQWRGNACPVLESSSPKVGSVGAAPKEVTLEFTSKIFPDKSTILVTDADGNTVNSGKPYGKSDDDKFIGTKLEGLKPGKYKVKWDVLCDCGDMNPGTYKFTVE